MGLRGRKGQVINRKRRILFRELNFKLRLDLRLNCIRNPSSAEIRRSVWKRDGRLSWRGWDLGGRRLPLSLNLRQRWVRDVEPQGKALRGLTARRENRTLSRTCTFSRVYKRKVNIKRIYSVKKRI